MDTLNLSKLEDSPQAVEFALNSSIQNDDLNLFEFLDQEKEVIGYSGSSEPGKWNIEDLLPRIIQSRSFNILKYLLETDIVNDQNLSLFSTLIDPTGEIYTSLIEMLNPFRIYQLASFAVKNNNITLVKWLLSKDLIGEINLSLYNPPLLQIAIENNSDLEIISLLHIHGPPFISDIDENIVKQNLQVSQWLQQIVPGDIHQIKKRKF